MMLGFVVAFVDVLTNGVALSGDAEELQTMRGFLFVWATDARREIFRHVLKYLSASPTVRIMLNPR